MESWLTSSEEARECSGKAELLSSYERNLRNLREPRQGNMDASTGEAADPKSLFSSYSDYGIHVNFQEDSGIVTF